MPAERRWIYQRKTKDGWLSDVFVEGVQEFVNFTFAHPEHVSSGKIRCPCLICRNTRFHNGDDVRYHLVKNGFICGYELWYAHGESAKEKGHAVSSSRSSKEDSNRQGPVTDYEADGITPRKRQGIKDFDSKSKRINVDYRAELSSNCPDPSVVPSNPSKGHLDGLGGSGERELSQPARSSSSINSYVPFDERCTALMKKAQEMSATLFEMRDVLQKREEFIHKREEDVKRREEELWRSKEDFYRRQEDAHRSQEGIVKMFDLFLKGVRGENN